MRTWTVGVSLVGGLLMVLACGGLGGAEEPGEAPADPTTAEPELEVRSVEGRLLFAGRTDWRDIHTSDDTLVAVDKDGQLFGVSPVAVTPLGASPSAASAAWLDGGVVRAWDGQGAVSLEGVEATLVHGTAGTVAVLDPAGQARCMAATGDRSAQLGAAEQVFAGYDTCCARAASGSLSCSTLKGATFSASRATGEVAVGSGIVCASSESGAISCAGPSAPEPPPGTGYTALGLGFEGLACALDPQGAPVCWDAQGARRYQVTGRGAGRFTDLAVQDVGVTLLRDDGQLVQLTP